MVSLPGLPDLPDVSLAGVELTYRNVARIVFASLVLVSLSVTVHGAVTTPNPDAKYDVGQQVAEPRNGTTVMTTSQLGNNFMTVVAPNGTVVYYNDTYTFYNDVDPSPAGKHTLLYVATRDINRDQCNSPRACHISVIERVNYSTGETERLYSRTTAVNQNQYHDVDRVGQNRYLVGDISHDRVYIINTTTGIETWSWHAQNAYPVQGGGIFPGDWTHLNDVEMLPDGRIMTNLRNQDSVVFIDPQTGIQRNWTLGADDDHSILYEAHNPDYIPASNGGPAVVVGDSENNRVVEYQRVDGEWQRSWVWRDTQMQWPRDADRLPNGHTLIADSNGRRVLEVNEQGEIVWKVTLDGVYDVERLNTGDESTGGPSAVKAGLEPVGGDIETSARGKPDYGLIEGFALWLKDRLPSPLVNGVLYVTPAWVRFREAAALLVLFFTSIVWGTLEWRWSPYKFTITSVDADGGSETGGGGGSSGGGGSGDAEASDD